MAEHDEWNVHKGVSIKRAVSAQHEEDKQWVAKPDPLGANNNRHKRDHVTHLYYCGITEGNDLHRFFSFLFFLFLES